MHLKKALTFISLMWTQVWKITNPFQRNTTSHGDEENIMADNFQVFHIVFTQNDLIDCDCYVVYVVLNDILLNNVSYMYLWTCGTCGRWKPYCTDEKQCLFHLILHQLFIILLLSQRSSLYLIEVSYIYFYWG